MYTVSKMKKPHMVKKWARPGIDHLSSRRCPSTSDSSAQIRPPTSSVRPETGWPDRVSLASQPTRRRASNPTIAVMPRPTTSLISICVCTERLPNSEVAQR